MPYLDAERKRHLDAGGQIVTAGDLTYLLTRVMIGDDLLTRALLDDLIARYLPAEPRFGDFAVVLGCLEATKREFVRRRLGDGPRRAHDRTRLAALQDAASAFYYNTVAPYEDTKIQQNGDVYS